MAFAQDDLKAKISDEVLNCQICMEHYNNPKSLPCLHTFCKGCLETYVRKQFSSKRGREIPCPICRNGFELPASGVEGLPTNFMYNNLLELLGEEKPKEKPQKDNLCESCCTMGGDKLAVAICSDCDEMLCSDCVDAHSRVKMTRDHKLTSLREIDNNAAVGDLKSKLNKPKVDNMDKEWMCKTHTSQKVTCICLQCVLPLCPFCISDILTKKSHAHKKHDIVGLEEAMTRFLGDMDSSLDNLRERISDVEDGLHTLEATEQVLTESAEQTKAEVAARAKEIKSAVDRWKSKMDKELDTNLKKNKDELSGRKLLLDSYMEKLNEGTKEVNDMINSGDSKVVMRKDELNKKIQILKMSTVFDMDSFPQPVKFTLSGVESGDIKTKLPEIMGEVKAEKTSRLQRFDSMSSLASALSDTKEGGRGALKKNWSVSASVLTTYRVNDVVMVGMAIGRRTGDFFAVDSKSREIYHFNLNNENRFHLIKKYGAKRLREPLDIDQLPDGRIVVSDGKEGHCVKIFTTGTGKLDAVIAHSVLKKACGVATTPQGDILVTDVDAQCILNLKCEGGDKFTQNWKIEAHKGRKQFESPQYVACGLKGEIVVTDRMKSQAKGFHANGHFKFSYGRFGSKSKQMRKPEGVCIDHEGRVYIADVDNKRIHVLSVRGALMGVINIPAVCGKFEPTPSMLAVTRHGHLMLGNEQGWLKILQVTIAPGEAVAV